MPVGLKIDGKLVDWSHNWDGAIDMVGEQLKSIVAKLATGKVDPKREKLREPIKFTVELVPCEVVETQEKK